MGGVVRARLKAALFYLNAIFLRAFDGLMDCRIVPEICTSLCAYLLAR